MSENKNNTTTSDNPSPISKVIAFSDLWKGVLRYWWVVLAACVLVSGGMFFRSYSGFNPRYEVSATFTVNTQVLSLTGEGIPSFSAVYDNATASNLEDTFPYIISSNILWEAIYADLDISYAPVRLSAEAISSTNMFTLKAEGGDPQLTYDVLVSAMKNYPSVAKYLVGNVRLTEITAPVKPTEPVNKFTYMVAFEGLLIGLLLGAIWIVFYALMRKTVKTKGDVQNKLNADVIGTLPEVTFKKYKNMEADQSILITNERIGRGFMESIRVFRNQFIHRVKENEKVVMVTSTAPGEGKTTVAVNLALSLTDIGKKVLIIDADLRNPSVAAAMNLAEDLTFDRTEDNYAIADLETNGLSFLKFTLKEHSYWKLINADYLKNLFDSLREQYDYVIVDTPPCGLVYDSSLIAQVCDTAIYVVLQDAVRIKKILFGMDNLKHSTDSHILGVVINGAQSGLAGYGEDYGYGGYGYGHYKSYSKYGYGYGYSHYYESGKTDSKSSRIVGRLIRSKSDKEDTTDKNDNK